MQQGTGVDLNPPKTPLRLKELIKTSVELGCELHQGLSHHPRGGIAASSQKMQRGVESSVLDKAQIGPVFIKSAKTEMSPFCCQIMQPWGTRNVCGFAWGGTVLSLAAALGDL